MAKEIVVWCDPCLDADQRTPSREVKIGLHGRWRTLDLCEQHEKELLTPLEQMVEAHGATVDVPHKAVPRSATTRVKARGNKETGPQPEATLIQFEQMGTRLGRDPVNGRVWQCLWCPLDYASTSGFSRHLRTAHDLSEYLSEVFVGLCPVCGKGDVEVMGSHIKKSHDDMGFRSLVDAYVWARDHGDPHGSYAAILAKAPVRG